MLKTHFKSLKDFSTKKITIIIFGISIIFLIGAIVLASLNTVFDTRSNALGETWRSTLYPEDWISGVKDNQGRYLFDYSYAGYHSGEKTIPNTGSGTTIDVTKSPYNADNTGKTYSQDAIQEAINKLASQGGGTIYLPAGTYKVKPNGEQAISITSSNIVIKGAGTDKTFIFNDQAYMRGKSVINFQPNYSFSTWEDGGNRLLEERVTKDIPENSDKIYVNNIQNYKVGDWILLKNSFTAEFLQQLTAEWPKSEGVGIQFYRQITKVNTTDKSLTIDEPTRFELLTRDRARINKIKPHIEEVGLMDLSIGNRENLTGTSTSNLYQALGENDNKVSGTAAYEVNQSKYIQMSHVVNGWIKNISSYKPSVNKRDIDILSKGIVLQSTRFVTIDSVNLKNTEYKGGGSNGYLFQVTANDTLIINSSAINGRHNYMMAGPESNGNVVTNSISKDGYISSDHHGKMSAGNLFDNITIDNDVFHALWNPNSGPGGPTTSQTVYWNIKTGKCGRAYFTDQPHSIQSQQYGWGYVIGTSGACSNVYTPGGSGTEPVDYTEGIGKGTTLEPQSLYLDQLNRKVGKIQISRATPSPTSTPTPTATLSPTLIPTATIINNQQNEFLFKFDEEDGNTIYDDTGNTTGSINGATRSVRSYSLNFDGQNDYVQTSGLGNDSIKNLTVSAWINPNDLTKFRGGIVSTFSNGGFRLTLDKDKLQFGYRNAPGTYSDLTSPIAIKQAIWTHVAATFDGNTKLIKLYINGELVAQKAGVDSLIAGKDIVEFGRNADNNDSTGRSMFKGQISDIKIYKKTLNDSEIRGTMY